MQYNIASKICSLGVPRPVAIGPTTAAVVMLILVSAVCVGCSRSKPAGEHAAGKTSENTAETSPATTDDEAAVGRLLNAMVAAYAQAESYADAAEVTMRGSVDGEPFEEKGNYSLALQRPNKLRLHAYQGTAVSDGSALLAWVSGIPNQVLKLPAPAAIGIDTIFANNVLADSMANGPTQQFAWVPLQLILLCGKDPLATLLFGADALQLLEPANVDERRCRRVQVRRSDGTCVFWIDEKSHVLRRCEFPVGRLSGRIGDKKLEVSSLVADFHGAALGGPIDAKAFAAELPPGVEVVEELAPVAVQMLGKTAPDFIFVGLDKKPLTLKSLSGKTTLMEFWSVAYMPCRDALAQIEKVYQKFKNNPRTALLAVSIDAGDVTDEQIAQAVEQMGLSVPVYRISQTEADRLFKIRGIPTTVILGPRGHVQGYQAGMMAGAASLINQEIELLLAGKDIAAETLHNFDAMKLRYAEIFQAMADQNLYVNPAIIVERMAVAKRSNPKLFKLKRLWTKSELNAASGILIVPPAAANTADTDKSHEASAANEADIAGKAKIFVVHGGRSVAELDADGTITADHELDLPEQESISRLQTCRTANGKRCYLGFAPGMQQVHLFDDAWRRLMSFPDAGPKSPHAGVGDARIADFDGDGEAELAVGYLGLVGVKGVSLAGDLLWSNRSIANVFAMAVGGPAAVGPGTGETEKREPAASETTTGKSTASHPRPLYCVNDRTTLVTIDPQGKVQRELSLDGRLLFAVAAENLDDKAGVELCGLSAPRLGENLAVGLDPQGNLLWSYQMPKGTATETVQRIVAARLFDTGVGQWILLGPDGSVHIVGVDGKPIDQFNYGETVTGLAAGRLADHQVLIFSSQQGVKALAVELPEQGKKRR